MKQYLNVVYSLSVRVSLNMRRFCHTVKMYLLYLLLQVTPEIKPAAGERQPANASVSQSMKNMLLSFRKEDGAMEF